ncbi:hypothetical protein CON65_15925 [Bacillus pseudomycoides]|uniref:Phage tail tape measure protein n=1 Tax=Bacillus pseudomycoides TaxID=64104 RepID=A0AA91VAY6_9BACI|nr:MULTISPECIES: hypothetical protein [Bacillus]PEB56244.1 hypothetical protein COO03_01360 [Bacillus sp. AFS098217]PED81674.1 hypothetical protein CON65_15925 [Bacillus pseudomycoides]
MASRVISAVLELRDRFSDQMRRAADNADDFRNRLKRVESQTSSLATVAVAKFAAVGAGVATISAATAPAVAGIGALGASFAAAGIGAAAFGAVSVSVLGDVFSKAEEVGKIEEKIADADTAKEKLAAQKELAAVYEDMGNKQKEAIKNLQEFKSFWGEFTKQFEEPVFALFGQGLKLTQAILKEMAPTISSVADVFVELMGEATNAIEAGGLKPFFEWLETNAAEALYSFAHIFGNTFAGIFSLLQAFAPLGASMEEGLLSLTEKFKNWAASVGESQGFKDFIDYAKTNGPVIMDILGNVFDVIVDVGVALAPLGEKLLGVFQNITNFLADSEGVKEFFQTLSDIGISIIDNWGPISDILISLTAGVAAFKIAMAGMEIIGIVNTLMMAWHSGTLMQTTAQLLLNSAMLANPLTWVAAAIAALIAIGVLLYLNWDTVKAKAGELWSWLVEKWEGIKSATSEAWNATKEYISSAIQGAWDSVVSTAESIWNSIVEKWNSVKQSTQETWDGIKTAISDAMSSAGAAISDFFSPLLNFIDSAKGAWDGFVGKITSFKMPSFSFPSLPSWLGGGGGADGSHATGLANVPFDGYKAVLHKGEAVLTASQSSALRDAGMLKENANGTPTLSFNSSDENAQGRSAVTTNTDSSNTSSTNNTTNKNNVVVNIYPQGTTAKEVINELVPQLELALANM